jgi:hypothetical protein
MHIILLSYGFYNNRTSFLVIEHERSRLKLIILLQIHLMLGDVVTVHI